MPDGTSDDEDAGYLPSVVLDGEKGTGYLLCLDARDNMAEVGRAETWPWVSGFTLLTSPRVSSYQNMNPGLASPKKEKKKKLRDSWQGLALLSTPISETLPL